MISVRHDTEQSIASLPLAHFMDGLLCRENFAGKA